jgi:hypothetical protein
VCWDPMVLFPFASASVSENERGSEGNIEGGREQESINSQAVASRWGRKTKHDIKRCN